MMDSKLKCVFVMPPSAQNLGVSAGLENNGDDVSVRSEYQSASQMKATIPPSPKVRTKALSLPCFPPGIEAARECNALDFYFFATAKFGAFPPVAKIHISGKWHVA